jgi:hypothetical protein
MEFTADTPVAAPQQVAFDRVRNAIAPGGSVAGSTSTRIEPPALIAFDSMQSGKVTRFRLEFAPVPGGCTLKFTYEWTGDGGMLAYPIMKRKLKKIAEEYRAMAEGRT